MFKIRRARRRYDEDCCPCCGMQSQIPGTIYFWEDERQVIRGNVVVNLFLPEFRCLQALFDAWPRKVPHEFLIDLMWDIKPDCLAAQLAEDGHPNLLSVKISNLRKQIKPLGMVIPFGIYSEGAYRLHIEKWPADREARLTVAS